MTLCPRTSLLVYQPRKHAFEIEHHFAKMIPMAVEFTLLLMTLVLCVDSSVDKMTTSNKTTTTPSRGVWAENNLYDTPPPIPHPRHSTGVPQTSNATSDPLEIPDTKSPLNDGQTRQRMGESQRSGHQTVASGCCIYYTDPLQCWACLQ